jgi:hypothetical protein
MTRSIRRLVGGGIAALALGCFFAFAIAPQVAATSSSRNIQSSLGAGIDLHEGELVSLMTSTKAVKPKVTVSVTAACTSARQALDAARIKDMAEDKAERSTAASDPNFKTTDPAEDQAEKAAMRPLVDAVRTACGFTKPPPSAACTSALQAMKAAMTVDRAEDTAEKAAGTDDSAADMTEDKTERAQFGTLWTSVRTACGFATFRERTETHFFGTTFWHH